MIRRVLIANRGEIARRVIRTCREMQIATVAVYSEADAGAPHVKDADASECIGPAPATASYLNIPAVIDAARRSGADAVHPGYGFLSENASFAEACEAAGLIFVGPPGAVIRRMGSKTGARDAVSAGGVPVVPGVTPASQDPASIAAAAASSLGLPVVLKAAGGGGGKGMRIVREAAALEESVLAARSEAERAFGNGTLYVERLIDRARHIEVQIMGDAHGHLVHLFERDCTLQRRHQKVIEEAPAPRLSPAVRARLTEAAIAAGRAVGYINAGTVEFLLEGDGDAAQFYFLEMNTRLQVEHPITEAITGLDLVRVQLMVASGEPLPFLQADIRTSGHAIECRIYAEDSRRLLPQAGRLLRYREPVGAGVRVDSGVVVGQTVTVHYDPLLAKLITHGATRDEAIARMTTALRAYDILGLRHNVSFLLRLLERPEVLESRIHTRFIETHLDELSAPPAENAERAAAAMAAFVASRDAEPVAVDGDGDAAPDPVGPDRPGGLVTAMPKRLHLATGATDFTANVSGATIVIAPGGEAVTVARVDERLRVDGAGQTWIGDAVVAGDVAWVTIAGDVFTFTVTHGAARARTGPRDQDAFTPPMSATVVRIVVTAGDAVRDGDVLIALEAMKMELPIRAPRDGVVKAVHCKTGELVQPGDVLLDMD